MVIVIIYLIVGLICAVTGGVLASTKGHAVAGVVLGFFFGPIGVVIALLLPTNHAALAQENGSEFAKKACPFCAELIQRAAIKCRFCGSDLPAKSDVSPPQTPAQDIEGTLKAAQSLALSGYSATQISQELQKWRDVDAGMADEIANKVVAALSGPR